LNEKWEVRVQSSIFWDITPCSSLKVDKSFGEEDGGNVFVWNVGLLSKWLHGVIYQVTELLKIRSVKFFPATQNIDTQDLKVCSGEPDVIFELKLYSEWS
jgi:hypothetical protein